jgi:hypothetical protein
MSPNTSGTSTPTEAIAPFMDMPKQSKHSAKQIWTSIKNAAIEHHRSVNAAYEVCYGQGHNRAVAYAHSRV